MSTNFFDGLYDNRQMWLDEIAWAVTPINKEIIIDTVNKFAERKMRGFIMIGVGFYTQDCNTNIWIESGQAFWQKIVDKSKFCLHLPAYLYPNDSEQNVWHSTVFYFNFQT